MHYDWILDVLTDLRTFAKTNGLPALAEQLDDTSLLAAAEIAQVASSATGGLIGSGFPAGAVRWGTAGNENPG